MLDKTGVVKGVGSEPKLSTREGEEGMLTWGSWSFTIEPKLELYGGAVHYTIRVGVHGDDDGGEKGMFGDLETGPHASLLEAANEAKQLRLTVRSLHCEDGDDDWCLYERTIDLSEVIDRACIGVLDAVKAEAQYIRERIDGLPTEPKLAELEAELLALRRASAERQAMLETYGKMIAELLPGATASGPPVEHARKFASMMVRKYLGLPTLGELVQRGVPIATQVTESDRAMKLVSMKSHLGVERGCVYDAVFLVDRERA